MEGAAEAHIEMSSEHAESTSINTSTQASDQILIIDDDSGIRDCIACLLDLRGHRTRLCRTHAEGLDAALSSDFSLIITDLRLPDGDGLDIIRAVKANDADMPIMLMTSYSSVDSAVKALRLGAVDYIIKPFDNEEFIHSVERALDEKRIKKENRILKRSLKAVTGGKQFIGESDIMLRLKDLLRRVAPTDANVLIQGETGTGKEVVAQSIHQLSTRADGPFIAINCGAIPHDLLESELFGHVKGAFTGAVGASDGLIRDANGGTLFLDEIGELPLNLQVKLLRAIQEHEVRPVGGGTRFSVNTRFVAASNKWLDREVEAGRFRDDLYYRLNVIGIHVPPLRERGEDVELLAKRFLNDFSKKLNKPIHGFADDFWQFLRTYQWPGNVRELENIIERAVIIGDSDMLNLNDILTMNPQHNLGQETREPGAHEDSSTPAWLHKTLSLEEYAYEFVRLYQDRYPDTELATMLGIGRKALWARRRKWGLFRTKRRNAQSDAELDEVSADT